MNFYLSLRFDLGDINKIKPTSLIKYNNNLTTDSELHLS